MAKYLVLYGPTHRTGQELRFRLAADADLELVQRRLDHAQPDEFVKVPVVLEDEIATLNLRVQPGLFGAWLVLDLPEGPDTPAPLSAARGRMPDVQRLFRQMGDAARQARQQLENQSE